MFDLFCLFAWLAFQLAALAAAEGQLERNASPETHEYLRLLDKQFENRRWTDSNLNPRQDDTSACEPLCGPDECGGSVCTIRKRSLQPLLGNVNTSSPGDEAFGLERRVFRPIAAGDIGQYLSDNNLDNSAVQGLCESYGAYNSYCIQQDFSMLSRTNPTYIGTKNTELTGCTVLTVASARGVYMCHFWETLGFVQSRTQTNVHPDFERNVINLVNGNSDDRFRASGPGLDVNLFNMDDDRPVAQISTPRQYNEEGNTKTALYLDNINALQDELRRLLPNLVNIIVRPYEKPWIPVTENGITTLRYPEDQLYRGQALFEYDPNAFATRAGADWRLFYEEANRRGSRGFRQSVQK